MTTSAPPVSVPFTLPAAGDVLAGKYEIQHVLGEGGMCVVMAARHLQLEERVAIKILRPEFAENPEVIERFMRDGRMAIRIRGDHVVQVHDVDVLPSGVPYLVMEHLEGHDLETLILAHGPSPVQVAIDYILQAGEAIAEAHALGIVHRDLKPANLFLTKRPDGSPWVKVLDFGISKMAPPQNGGLRQERLTGNGAVMGSPHYMSPEQLRSTRDVDLRTDIWALGTILHELLSGSPAFDGPSLTAICAKIMEQSPPSLMTLRADVPSGVAVIVLRCLEKDPDDRFASMAELAVALANFGSAAGRASAQLIVGILKTDSVPPTGGILVHSPGGSPWVSTGSAWEGVPKTSARRRSAGVLLGALIVAATAGLGLYVHTYSPVASAAPAAASTRATVMPAMDSDAGIAPSPAPAASVSAPATVGKPLKRSAPSARPSAPRPDTLLFDERK